MPQSELSSHTDASGSKGQRIPVRVNAFPVTKFTDAIIQQCEPARRAQWPFQLTLASADDVAVVGDDKIPIKVKRKIWQALEKMNALGGNKVVYDGAYRPP
jgi:hypothetical protein